jgi:hypothetical protein
MSVTRLRSINRPSRSACARSGAARRPECARISSCYSATATVAEFDALLQHIPAGDGRSLAGQWYRLDENAVPPEYCLLTRTGEFVTPTAWHLVEQTLHQTLAQAARVAGLPETEKYEASATHQEILAGLGNTQADRQHVFGFVRRPTRNADPRLEELKSHMRVHEFNAGDMKALCDLVLAQLSDVIEQEVKRFEDRAALELEIEAHDRFAEDRCRIFTGRQAVLETIADYISGSERRPLVLRGESGSGKSAVMAKASQEDKGPGRVIRRFIDALKVWDIAGAPARHNTGRTPAGHSAEVRGVAAMPDGKRAVSASGDYTLKVWDVDTGRVEGHSAFVSGVAVIPDGKRVGSASGDYTLKVWDLDTGPALRTLEGHSSYVYGVAVTPDATLAVSASWDHTLKVWDLETGRALRTLEGHSGYVNGLAVTPDGQRAVSASYDKTLKVWDLDTGTLCARWKATFLRSMAWRSRRMLRGLFQRGGTAC